MAKAPATTWPPLTVEQQRLVESMAPWCRREAAKWASMLRQRRGLWDPDMQDELFNAAMLMVSQAAQRFDPSRGRKFMTLATWWCRRGLQAQTVQTTRIGPSFALESGFIRKGTPSTCAVMISNDGDESQVQPRARSQDAGELSSDFLLLVGMLEPRERTMLVMQVVDEEPTRVIASRFGISRTRVQQVVRRALAKLRENSAARAMAGIDET